MAMLPREKVEKVRLAYIMCRGPERAWQLAAPDCGYANGRELKTVIDKYCPLYGLPVPPRQYELMSSVDKLRVEEEVKRGAARQQLPIQLLTGQDTRESSAPLQDSSPLLEEYAMDGESLDKGVDKHKLPLAPYGSARGEIPIYYSRPDNSFAFGATSDNHIGSKYHRDDVLIDLYKRFTAAQVDCVFNAGNWIDGYHAKVNHFDLIPGAHTMEDQLRLLVEHYPKYEGPDCVEIGGKKHHGTFAVTGDDHEGWWARAHGFPIGDRAQDQMRKAGRTDWHDLGYMEAHVRLVNINTGKSCLMSVVHPGGGTAYAISYHPQKRVEALEGGEKPAIDLSGHLHKLFFFNIRNVWCIGTGCTQDITPFIRNRVRQEVHVGGQLVHLEQDPETGAIVGCGVKTLRYFVRHYYEGTNNRWSKDGPVSLPKRTIGGV